MVGDTLATDKGLKLSGGLKLGKDAILQLNEAMANVTYHDGDKIQAFTGTATGTFAEIIPAIPGDGLKWDVSELYDKGLLKVVVDTASAIGSVEAVTTSEYFGLSGERIATPAKGICIERTTTADGKVTTRKINY